MSSRLYFVVLCFLMGCMATEPPRTVVKYEPIVCPDELDEVECIPCDPEKLDGLAPPQAKIAYENCALRLAICKETAELNYEHWMLCRDAFD